MKYWILINTYLWKNIFNRWFESPLAPLSKVVLCFLLSLLSFVVIGLLKNGEDVLREQLSHRDVLTSVVTVQDMSQRSPVIKMDQSLYREATFKTISADSELDYFRRVGVTAKDSVGNYYPIIVCFSKPTFWEDEWGEFDRPEIYFFCDDSDAPGDDLEIRDLKVEPQRLPKLELLSSLAKNKGVIIVPYPMGWSLLKGGFAEIVVLRSSSVDSMKSQHQKLEAHCVAERLSFSLYSALPLLNQLELFAKMQRYVQSGLTLLIIIITAIVLGNQSLLEFREQQYVFALLRSFGSPLSLIMLAELFEKILLCLLGVWLAYLSLEPLASVLKGYIPDSSMVDVKVALGDIKLISLGVVSGVFSSWCFLFIAARKPVGLTLS